jgi:hypothetical protein
MTNEEFIRLAWMQKANAEYAQREKVKDMIGAVCLISALIAGGLILLALFAFSFVVDFGTIAPTTAITLLLVLILFKLK